MNGDGPVGWPASRPNAQGAARPQRNWPSMPSHRRPDLFDAGLALGLSLAFLLFGALLWTGGLISAYQARCPGPIPPDGLDKSTSLWPAGQVCPSGHGTTQILTPPFAGFDGILTGLILTSAALFVVAVVCGVIQLLRK